LLKLVIDIVDLSKIEVGKLSLSREWTSLDPVVEAALSATRTLADKKRIALSVSLQPDLPKVWVDPVRMQQVLSNLLAFAVAFPPEGDAVGLTAYADHASVHIAVTNNGVGVEPEELPLSDRHIEPIECPPGEQAEDAGLGLALAKRLLEMHGGCIQVSTDARGRSTFTATIPMNQQDEGDLTHAA
jgi:signal transduction histidine kinase